MRSLTRGRKCRHSSFCDIEMGNFGCESELGTPIIYCCASVGERIASLSAGSATLLSSDIRVIELYGRADSWPNIWRVFSAFFDVKLCRCRAESSLNLFFYLCLDIISWTGSPFFDYDCFPPLTRSISISIPLYRSMNHSVLCFSINHFFVDGGSRSVGPIHRTQT